MEQGKELKMKRDVESIQVWRNTLPGMWAWLWQRISAVLIVLFLSLHLFFPYRKFVQFMLIMVVMFHASLGLRVILIDVGVSVKAQKVLFGVMALFALFGFIFIWYSLPIGG